MTNKNWRDILDGSIEIIENLFLVWLLRVLWARPTQVLQHKLKAHSDICNVKVMCCVEINIFFFTFWLIFLEYLN